MAALVLKGNQLRQKLAANENFPGEQEWAGYPQKMPAPVARLAQCLVEEAEAAPETLTAILQLLAFFARGCRSAEDWGALSRGPYGEELLHQVWLLYRSMEFPDETWIKNTFAAIAALRLLKPLKDSREVLTEMQRLLKVRTLKKPRARLRLGLGICI